MGAIICDTSALFAAMTDTHPSGSAVRDLLYASAEPPIVSPFVLAELDYLVATRIGVQASLSVIDELTSGAYDIPSIDSDDIRVARPLIDKYADLNIGLTDAINVVLAHRYETDAVLTFDKRHFHALVPLTPRIRSFNVLPA